MALIPSAAQSPMLNFEAVAGTIDGYLTAYGSFTIVGSQTVPIAPALDMKALARSLTPPVLSDEEHDKNLFCAPRGFLGAIKLGDGFDWEGGNGKQRYTVSDIRAEKHGNIVLFLWLICDLNKA